MIDPSTDLAALADRLAELLPEHLAHQRWAGAHDQAVTGLVARWWEVVHADAEAALLWGLVDAVRGDEPVAFQLFVGLRPEDEQPEFLEGKEREAIGPVVVDGRPLVAYDALVDPELAVAVLHLVAPDEQVEVRRPIVLEHSNSSVVFDERLILKLLRRIEPGPNPDLEITRRLAARGSAHVLPPLAELQRDGTDLAVLREFLVGATDGWGLARTSVRDVLASRLPPEEAGGDFAPEAERLGVVLAELHVELAAVWPPEPADPPGWAGQMEEQLDQLLARGVELPPGVDADQVRARYRVVQDLADAGRQIRVHGDLHLAQVIRVDDGWRILDFEGEPARRRDDRFTTSSPLRDVAGVLRSFHYAAATGLAEWGADDGEMREVAHAWEQRNRDAFLDGYLGTAGVADLLPADAAARADVLAAFELDKAVYELGYELAHRPDQIAIPAEGIARLARPVPT